MATLRSSTSTLGLGAMSADAIEATFKYSEARATELMLIASKNQIDYAGGYVHGWTTAEYIAFVDRQRKRYPRAEVLICRDHCGPGFNERFDIEDTYRTIATDIECGFDLLHIDFCHFPGDREEMLREARRAIEFALALNPAVQLEIGTDDNRGDHLSTEDLERLEQEVEFFLEFCAPTFYVVQTGSLVKEARQIGSFNAPFVRRVSDILGRRGLQLKEHNADFLSRREIEQRRGVVGAMNIAPQLGVVQTAYVLKRCSVYRIDSSEFINACYSSGRWRKWLCASPPDDAMLYALTSGHYCFDSEEYKRLIQALCRYEDVHTSLVGEVWKVVEHYERSQKTVGARALA